MFCPSCGLQEAHSNQFCRACGTDLRFVRTTLEKPDSITASAITARDEISRAIAAKIQNTKSAEELSTVAEEVLPQIEKFLESPEERRLRRIRNGSLISFIGLGTMIGFAIAATIDDDFIVVAACGLVTFFIGLAFVVNGMFFSVPKNQLTEKSNEAAKQRELDGLNNTTNDLLMPPDARTEFSSVTEHTTRHLKNKM